MLKIVETEANHQGQNLHLTFRDSFVSK